MSFVPLIALLTWVLAAVKRAAELLSAVHKRLYESALKVLRGSSFR